TVTYGVRYVRDTGRSDSDLPALPAVNLPSGPVPFNTLLPGLGNRVNQPNHNFGPQLGVAWDPRKESKTVIRAGIGVFYENAIWNNVEFDRPERLATGAFLANPTPCINGAGAGVPDPTNQTVPIFLGGSQSSANFICGSLIGATIADAAGDTCNGLSTSHCIANFQT